MRYKMENSQRKFDLVFKHIDNIMLLVDTRGNILYQTASVRKMLGFPVKSCIGLNIIDRIHNNDKDDFLEILRSMSSLSLEHKCFLTCRISHKNKNWIKADVTFTCMLRDSIFNSIILNIKNHDKDRKIALSVNHTNYLETESGLLNLNVFSSSLRKEIFFAKKEKKTLMVMALSFNFMSKETHPEISPELGGLLLKTGGLLKKLYRQNDKICRIAPDQFYVLFSDILSKENIDIIVRKTTEFFRTPILYREQYVDVSFNLGITFFPFDGITAEELLHNSGQALVKAKKEGPNLYEVFNPY